MIEKFKEWLSLLEWEQRKSREKISIGNNFHFLTSIVSLFTDDINVVIIWKDMRWNGNEKKWNKKMIDDFEINLFSELLIVHS